MNKTPIPFSIEFLQNVYPEFYQECLKVSAIQTVTESMEPPAEPRTIEEKLQVISTLPLQPIPVKPSKPVVVILAAGKGSRMGIKTSQKVLSPIAGKPALQWALETYRLFGLEHFIVIVGVGYQDVIQNVGQDDPHVTFLFQEAQQGTGHACRLASRYLQYLDYEGDVLVVMGDKFVTRRGLDRLLNDHDSNKPDLTLTAGAKEVWPDSGRVVLDEEGHVCAIIEKPDIVLKQLVYDLMHWSTDPIVTGEFLTKAQTYWDRPQKLQKMLGDELWKKLHKEQTISKAEVLQLLKDNEPYFTISESIQKLGYEIETTCDRVNLSLYLFGASALYDSMEHLKPDNAQGELYLTDAAYYLASRNHGHDYRVSASNVPHDYDVMGFNTRKELERIEAHIKKYNLLDDME